MVLALQERTERTSGGNNTKLFDDIVYIHAAKTKIDWKSFGMIYILIYIYFRSV